MVHVAPGSTVTLEYVGTLDDGRIFQSTADAGPIKVTLGAGELFPALEKAILGMRQGEARNVVLTAEEAYGPHLRENVLVVARDLFPAGRPLVVGQKLAVEFAGGSTRTVRVAAVDGDRVTLDANHALAGCELTFAVKVVEVA